MQEGIFSYGEVYLSGRVSSYLVRPASFHLIHGTHVYLCWLDATSPH